MLCPLSRQEITDPIVVHFENGESNTYQASVFFDAVKNASTRKPSGFVHNIASFICTNPAHHDNIRAFLDLPYASLRQPELKQYVMTRSPSMDSLEGCVVKDGNINVDLNQNGSRASSRASNGSGGGF